MESFRELADVINVADLLQRHHVGVDTPEDAGHKLTPALASQQDVVGGDAQRAAMGFSGSRHRKRTYNATVQGQRDSRLTELVFLDRGPVVLRCLVVAVAAAACGVVGTLLVRLHQTLAAELAAHSALNPLQTLIADGSSIRTLWPGWVAALCFGAAVLRLRRGTIEPPPGRSVPERLTPGQLRAGLRREYVVVRVALVLVSLLAAMDVARTAASVIAADSGDTRIGATLPATAIEAVGYAAAALMLAVWAFTFGAEVRRLGAM